ncbi:MAG: family efflux transporter permease subunit [Glaciihabitans sp.]|nr:family efflux transporter permease subunit [Glaciihabitans sp.]
MFTEHVATTPLTREQRLVIWIAILASFVSFLDGSVINVALPAIARELGGGLTTQQWAVDAYLITLGSLILLAGSLSDVLGRVVILRIGLIGFGVASLLCAIAPNPEILIVARGLQGIAGALLVPSSLALITSTFSGMARSKAIGQWTAGTTIAFVAGPILGGLIVDSVFGWRFVFVINVIPIGITLYQLAILGRKDVREEGVRIDFLGAILCVIGLGGPVYALIEQGHFGWGSPVILIPFVVGIVSFVAFIWRQRVAKSPLMPLSLFTVRNFAVGNVATAFIYGALSLGGFLIVVFLQQVAGWSATYAALATLPLSILNIALSSWFGMLSGRYGARWFMGFGPILGGIGFLLMLSAEANVDQTSYWYELLPGILLFGLGLSATVAPLTAAILGAISEQQSGIGSAVNNAVSRVAGLIAIAFVGLIVGQQLDVDGFHRGLIVTATLLITGGVVSVIGIQNMRQAKTDQVN